MNNFKFQFEWMDGGPPTKVAEHQATWCQLSIVIDNVVVTRHEDRRLQTVKQAVMIPLYPLAEWVAVNWWCLQNEGRNRRPENLRRFSQRHNLRYAADGYSLPSLMMEVGDGHVVLEWSPASSPFQHAAFLEQGGALMEREIWLVEIRRLVESVLERCQSVGLNNTLLEEEWQAISGLGLDEERFCQAAGALGIDPFGISEQDAELIAMVGDHLLPAESELKRDFFSVAALGQLEAQAHWVVDRIATPSGFEATLNFMPTDFDTSSTSTPWEAGYSAARKARQLMRMTSPVEMLELGRLAKNDPDKFMESPSAQALTPNQTQMPFEGLVSHRSELEFILSPRSKMRTDNWRFTFSRAVYDCLVRGGQGESATLLTKSHRDRQRANRAFAAELLAPEAGIRQLLGKTTPGEDDISWVAEHFGVSDMVVRHQIENHRIASIVS
ncbi:MAG: ImmA/IrrE family metallo-endopeptidase [Prosthecobacter sp.]|uniref:ImmA/IrrE family metallo-endopeptidase n=1 Tax=Prosthecobacter sp. TaxID=1965333 RepID=UPI0039020312